MSTKLKLFGYIRVSTKGQVKAPGGLRAQEEQIRKWCELQGHKLLKLHSDPGISSIDKRPAFEKMLKELEAKKADGVVVTKLDRFGRSVQDLVLHINQLQDRMQHFISVGDNIDTSTPNGRLLFHILAAFAEFEREIIRERMKAGRARAEKMGKLTHRPRKLLTDPKQLEEIKKLHFEKKVSAASLARVYGVSRPTMNKRLREMGAA
ncbi:recombinase family protein [Candidatus Acetothermia bacterium]|nr:recombinase family protein [Candidatus Acetothermia bacterium]